MANRSINSLVEKTAPTEEPITIEDAKRQLRLEINDDDNLIKVMIKAARIMVETFLHRSLIDTTWTMKLDCFPTGSSDENRTIRLTRSPADSIVTIKYIDEDGTLQTLAATEYKLDSDREPARITEEFDKTWPDTRSETNAVEIEYIAGYGAYADVPESIKAALRLIVAHMYEDRESMTSLNLKELPIVNSLLNSHRIPELI